MTTLAGFLLDRITEEERIAQACVDANGKGRSGEMFDDGSGSRHCDDFPSYPWGSDATELAYMKIVHPARMLIECEAKRRIIRLHGDSCDLSVHGCPPILRCLAAPYVDRPDFQDEWLPN